MQRSVEYIVHKTKEKTIEREFNGVPLDGSLGSFEALRDAKWLKTILTR